MGRGCERRGSEDDVGGALTWTVLCNYRRYASLARNKLRGISLVHGRRNIINSYKEGNGYICIKK